jgi:hypothetical protein
MVILSLTRVTEKTTSPSSLAPDKTIRVGLRARSPLCPVRLRVSVVARSVSFGPSALSRRTTLPLTTIAAAAITDGGSATRRAQTSGGPPGRAILHATSDSAGTPLVESAANAESTEGHSRRPSEMWSIRDGAARVDLPRSHIDPLVVLYSLRTPMAGEGCERSVNSPPRSRAQCHCCSSGRWPINLSEQTAVYRPTNAP